MKRRDWLLGKGRLGYKVMSSGTAGKDDYLIVTIPKGAGFELGDRVFMKPVSRAGVEGLFLTKSPPHVPN